MAIRQETGDFGLPKQHFLYFVPLPHGDGPFRPTLGFERSYFVKMISQARLLKISNVQIDVYWREQTKAR
jgi:hypothetical protein